MRGFFFHVENVKKLTAMQQLAGETGTKTLRENLQCLPHISLELYVDVELI